ncbi:aminotransferase class I/II-fold pyridoxal phosphate-dependent enzyme [Paenibacillus macerans]|uniref:Aminotransferase n=2 Tax=Paenibacillus macerans TaxID=44252 RepID=A0A090Z582_PAEMA|nr:aminotransferase class I/II-fold pyridoxal phosphate-dependent enzyme [Paenibacillus macerans]KFN05802.1 aminotransferase class-V family protein [Paenibacillus macerans]MCY7560122.1 aminotransferase class I/II-fold pyridoxal phosphate-dependent enzyme [Paenibacillus macerans]MEC0135490.1 aminotransferase class I/II-fold pyridoxal phosphate-dependent enzyme [Paenibacillus macerans]MEC0149696.1 aminotransferase class I/II-fold pyridoxal phosphate-dependent enzyme [Paenibacillus macerans]SUA85
MMSRDWIAPQVRQVPPSGIRKYFDLSGERADTIRLGVGEPDFTVPEPVREACVRALNEGRTGYTANSGMAELREALAGYLKESFGLGYEPESEIMITVGSSEAVDLALRACTVPGDEILIPAPGYVAYPSIAQFCGGNVVEVETMAAQRFKLTAAALAKRITPRSKVLIVNFPGNPTGAIMTEEDWRPVAELAIKHDLIVISDEVYAELTYGRKHFSIASLPGMKERTVVVSGFSKAFAMTGWRVGYVACGNRDLMAGMLKIHQYTAMCAPTLGQVAALASLRHGLEAKERMKETFDRRRRSFVQGLRELGLPCHEPRGAFYAFPSIVHTGLGSAEFAELLLREAGVAAVPGHVFGAGGEGHIRFSYAAGTQSLYMALERMEPLMRRLGIGAGVI